MTYRKALAEFKSQVFPRWRERVKEDKPEVSLAWSMFIDALVRSGRAQERHASRWGNPFYK